MKYRDRPEAFGVFKPVNYVVVAFPPQADIDAAAQMLRDAGFADEAIIEYTAAEMHHQTGVDLEDAHPLASLGQEMNLVKAHRSLAEQGHSFLVVHAPKDEQAQKVAEVARRFGAARAQWYGHLIIEELISVGSDENQVAESPDRGLDSQNTSGREGEDTLPVRP
jgi:hypothetical protein